jgi:hypothetical protein
MERVHNRLANLQVLVETGLVTPKEYAQRRALILEAAIDGPTLKRASNAIPAGALERGAGKRPLKRVRLTDFEYNYVPEPGMEVPLSLATTSDVDPTGDDDSTFSGIASLSSSSSSSSSDEDETTSELSEQESATPTRLWMRDPHDLFDFTRPKS